MVAMRVIFAGTPKIAVPSLQALVAAGHDIVTVVTQPDARGRRGTTLYPSPVKQAALDLGLPVLTPVSAREESFIAAVADLGADIAAVVAYGQILSPDLLATTTHGWVNLHFSLLPAWRGAAPVQRAIMAGDDLTGASTFIIEQGLDTGPVLGTLTETIRSDDTAGTLLTRLAAAGAPLLTDSLTLLHHGQAAPEPQPSDSVSYAAKLTRDDARVNWDHAAHVVDRQIRGCTPAPGAWTTLPDGRVAKLGPVRIAPDRPGTAPGQVRASDDAVVVGTGTDPVELGEIAPAGGRPMPALAWWRGARLAETAVLGEA